MTRRKRQTGTEITRELERDFGLHYGDLIADNYIVDDVLARGFAGVVCRATGKSDLMDYVVKLIRLDDPLRLEYASHLGRFFQVFGGAQTPNLLIPIVAGQREGYRFEVYPFMHGAVGLEQIIKDPEWRSLADRIDILSQIAGALIELHSKALIHADLKPSNILIRERPRLSVCLTDFGMVRSVGTRDFVIFGTYEYVHPSFRSGLLQRGSSATPIVINIEAGSYIDIYALGVISLQLLTGKSRLPDSINPFHLMSIFQESPGLQTHTPRIQRGLAELVYRMLNVDPAPDSLSANQVEEGLRSFLTQIIVDTEKKMPLSTVPMQREVQDQDWGDSQVELRRTAHEVQTIREELVAQTRMFVAESGHLQSIRRCPSH